MGRLFGDERGAAYRAHRVSAQDGLRLFVREYGPRHGDTVLCLHGLTRNSQDFHPLATRLSATHRVLVPDYRGRGRSAYDSNWRNYVPAVYLGDINHCLTAMGVEHCAVIGTSLGGLLGMAFGTAMPTRLAGLLLNDIGPRIPLAGIERIKRAIADNASPADWDAAVDHLKTCFPDLPAEDDADWRVIAGAAYRERADGKLEHDWDPAIVRAVGDEPPASALLWRLFRSVDGRPLAAVRGELTGFIDDALWQEMAEARPDMLRCQVPGVGHAPSLVEDAAVQLIDEWLVRCFRRTGPKWR